MIPLAEPLDTADFDLLVESALARLPNLAEEWTDYNYSDPGITLVELLAWVADSQIYSIGRNRIDERMAMARLLGHRPRNAQPARGTLCPADEIAAPFRIDAGTRVTAVGAVVPSLQAALAVDIWPLSIDKLIAHGAESARDVTDINAQPGASFAAFGEPPSADAWLEIVLKGTLTNGEVQVSLGFELANESYDTAPDLSNIEVSHFADGEAEPMRVVYDETAGLQRSGALIVAFQPRPGSSHTLRLANAGSTLLPKIRRIAPNAVPVVQQVTLRIEDLTAIGLPNQQIDVDLASRFASDEPVADVAWWLSGAAPVAVQVAEGQGWTDWISLDPGALLDGAGPDDRVFTVSEGAGTGGVEIGFGNGINGLRPPDFAQIGVTLTVSAGEGGNVKSQLGWKFAGYGVGWRNALPIAGGTNPDAVTTLLRRMKRRLRDDRVLATAARLAEAAMALPSALGVARAEVVEGWEPGRRQPANLATRTLIVARRETGSETPGWLGAIRSALRGRLALGERLIVVAPDWRDLRIRVAARASRGFTTAQVRTAIAEELAERLSPRGTYGSQWPVGRPVTRLAVEGWLRLVKGVERIDGVELLDAGGSTPSDSGRGFARNSLPRWIPANEDVRVTAGGGEA